VAAAPEALTAASIIPSHYDDEEAYLQALDASKRDEEGTAAQY
jgi:hypothetical protein